MNEIVKKILLAGEKFIPEMQLKQPVFTYNACEPFTKNDERIKKFISRYIFKIYLSKRIR